MKKLCAWLTILILLLAALPAPAETQALDGFELAAQNSRLSLYAQTDSGQIILEDRASGYLWHSNPQGNDKKAKGAHRQTLLSQLIVTYSNERGTSLSAASAAEAVSKGGLEMMFLDQGLVAVYDFQKPGIKIRVEYKLGPDYLSVILPTAGIETYPDEEGNENLNTVTAVDLLPVMGAGSSEEEGWLLVPDGSGALIHFNNGTTSMTEYNANLYGKDAGVEGQIGLSETLAQQARTREQTARLPVFGTFHEGQGGQGLLGVITQNDAKGAVLARVSNLTSYNYAWSRFRVRNGGSMMMNSKEFGASVIGVSEREGLTTGEYEVRYYPLSGERAGYAGMADTYRAYLIQEKGLSQRVAQDEYPLYLELYGQVKKAAQILGIPYTKTVNLTTLADVREITDKLGDTQTVVRYANWMPGSYYEKMPSAAKLAGSLGKPDEMRALDEALRAKGGGLFPAADLINIYKGGRGYWAIRDAVLTPVNSPQMQFEMAANSKAVNPNVAPWTLLSPGKYDQFFTRYFDSFNKTGLSGLALDAVGEIASSDNRSGGTGRGLVPGIVRDTLGKARQDLMLTGGNAYAAALASHVLSTPGANSGYTLTDESIPFYQMVFHGYVPYGIGLVNHAADPELFLLKCLEVGASPQYAFVGRNAGEVADTRLQFLYSPDFALWEQEVKAGYQRLAQVLMPLAHLPITGYQNLPGGCTMTEYGGQTRVYINHSGQEATVEGHVIPPRSFVVVEADDE